MKTLQDMLAVNRDQAAYYDSIHEAQADTGIGGYARAKRAGFATRIWASARLKQQQAVSAAGVTQRKLQAHEAWLSQKRGGVILEVGCFSGSEFTIHLAGNAGHYVGIELSPKASQALREKLAKLGLADRAEVITGDFLSYEEPRRFDLIYCHAVLHHFENPLPAFARLASLLKPDGLLLFTEPSAVNPVYSTLRRLYRPFQSDRAWEWPFTKATVRCFEQHFQVIHGFGWGRNSLLLSMFTMLPLLGAVITRSYVRQVQKEVGEIWGPEVWKNSYVTGIARLRNPA